MDTKEGRPRFNQSLVTSVVTSLGATAKVAGALLVAAGLGAGVWWAGRRGQLVQTAFSLETSGAGNTKGLLVRPRSSARFPAIVYLCDSGGSLPSCQSVLRRMAELGCAAVAIKYDEKDQARFDQQLLALHRYLERQPWAHSYAVAWVGFGLGAQRSLSFLPRHPETQPQIYVRLGGGMVPEVESKVQSPESELGGQETGERRWGTGPEVRRPRSVPSTPGAQLSTILLVQGERDEVFPAAECRKVGEILAANGARVETRILPGLPHDFAEEFGIVMRGAAEYCLDKLPSADYTVALPDCRLSDAEKVQFNLAMTRAGENRTRLWKAIASLAEPERHTAMVVLGGLEDYDLAHISGAHLVEVVEVAWEARRAYPWCREAPLEVFEKFTAWPRAFEEPLERVQSDFSRRLTRVVKYCRNTAEACDAIGRWERQRATWKGFATPEDPAPSGVLANRGGDCQHLISLFIYLARSVGLPVRPVMTTWPTQGTGHYWAEIWDVRRQSWHGFDGSAAERPFNFDWMSRVPKAATHAAMGERGAWNAAKENRWEAFTNTVGLFYPSGSVRVVVSDNEAPKANQRINVQVWLSGEVVHVTSAPSDDRGEARFTLGQSARRPYRFALAEGSQPDWEWQAVRAGEHYELTLRTDQTKPFDVAAKPPPLGFPEWEKPK